MADFCASLQARVKEIQRTDPAGKTAWWQYVDSQGGNVRDPAKHSAFVLQNFISQYDTGVFADISAVEPSGGNSLADLVKEGQRSSFPFKEAWASYVNAMGLQANDPTRQSKETLKGFLDFLGTRAMTAGNSKFGGNGSPNDSVLQAVMDLIGGTSIGKRDWNNSWGSEPPKKRQNVSTGNAEKDDFVQKVKDFQRSGEEQKQAWWAFCDQQPHDTKVANRDPSRYEIASLQQFCFSNGI